MEEREYREVVVWRNGAENFEEMEEREGSLRKEGREWGSCRKVRKWMGEHVGNGEKGGER